MIAVVAGSSGTPPKQARQWRPPRLATLMGSIDSLCGVATKECRTRFLQRSAGLRVNPQRRKPLTASDGRRPNKTHKGNTIMTEHGKNRDRAGIHDVDNWVDPRRQEECPEPISTYSAMSEGWSAREGSAVRVVSVSGRRRQFYGRMTCRFSARPMARTRRAAGARFIRILGKRQPRPLVAAVQATRSGVGTTMLLSLRPGVPADHRQAD